MMTKRNWILGGFRFGLPAMLVSVVMASSMLWLNLQEKRTAKIKDFTALESNKLQVTIIVSREFGWPWKCIRKNFTSVPILHLGSLVDDDFVDGLNVGQLVPENMDYGSKTFISISLFICNSISFFIIIVSTIYFTEILCPVCSGSSVKEKVKQ